MLATDETRSSHAEECFVQLFLGRIVHRQAPATNSISVQIQEEAGHVADQPFWLGPIIGYRWRILARWAERPLAKLQALILVLRSFVSISNRAQILCASTFRTIAYACPSLCEKGTARHFVIS